MQDAGAGLIEDMEGLKAGAALAHYRIGSKLGEGGMGAVYLARDTRLDREVAVKVLRAEVAKDAARMGRFEQEARLASSLNHPNIAHIYEIGEWEGAPFLAMEYVEGEALTGRIARRAAAAEGSFGDWRAGGRCVGRGAREGDRTQGHQAGEYRGERARACEDSGLRIGEARGEEDGDATTRRR